MLNKYVQWDAHVCPPLEPHADLSFLHRYKRVGISFVSLNVGFGVMHKKEVMGIIKGFTKWINKHNSDFALIEKHEQVYECLKNKKLGIAFDIEGSSPLNDEIEMLKIYYDLGVRQISLVYNKNNAAGGGCLEKNDLGLTTYGKELVKAANEIGLILDCSHCGEKTSLDIIEYSDDPVIFSHSNANNLFAQPRNISDTLIKSCAQKGGVIGINGVGIFLGNNDINSFKIFQHIDYVANLVGVQHVGIGLDCIFDNNIHNTVKNNPHLFPLKYNFQSVCVAEPEQLKEIVGLLKSNNYSSCAISSILGENFFRIAKNVWQ